MKVCWEQAAQLDTTVGYTRPCLGSHSTISTAEPARTPPTEMRRMMDDTVEIMQLINDCYRAAGFEPRPRSQEAVNHK
jgi:hypothetical protein